MACDDKNETIQPPGFVSSVNQKTNNGQSESPAINLVKTKELFALASEKKIGDKVGLFEMRENGILVHPGETQSTRINFRLSRSFYRITVRSFIAPLPPEASVKEAGTVGVEFFVDGKSLGRAYVDRYSKQIDSFDLTDIEMLTVVVDNGNGKPWFDWLMLAVVELK